MRWNPCGMQVAALRSGYEVDVRPFKNSDQVVRIRWFKCHPAAKPLPFASVIRPQPWHSEDWQYQGRGEVWATDDKYRQYPAPPGLDGQHHCGTREDFEEGGTFDPDAPPVPVSAEGIPLCCAAAPRGLVVGGPYGVAARGVKIGGAGLLVQRTWPDPESTDFVPIFQLDTNRRALCVGSVAGFQSAWYMRVRQFLFGVYHVRIRPTHPGQFFTIFRGTGWFGSSPVFTSSPGDDVDYFTAFGPPYNLYVRHQWGSASTPPPVFVCEVIGPIV